MACSLLWNFAIVQSVLLATQGHLRKVQAQTNCITYF